MMVRLCDNRRFPMRPVIGRVGTNRLDRANILSRYDTLGCGWSFVEQQESE